MIVYIRTTSQDYEIFWSQNMLLCLLNHESRILFYSSPYNDSFKNKTHCLLKLLHQHASSFNCIYYKDNTFGTYSSLPGIGWPKYGVTFVSFVFEHTVFESKTNYFEIKINNCK